MNTFVEIEEEKMFAKNGTCFGICIQIIEPRILNMQL